MTISNSAVQNMIFKETVLHYHSIFKHIIDKVRQNHCIKFVKWNNYYINTPDQTCNDKKNKSLQTVRPDSI